MVPGHATFKKQLKLDFKIYLFKEICTQQLILQKYSPSTPKFHSKAGCLKYHFTCKQYNYGSHNLVILYQ